MIDYRLYLVTDDPSRYDGNWLDNVVAAVEGGVTCVQYRDTESTASERFTRVRALQDVLRAHHTPLIVNNEAALAAAVNAEGVHVGQGDMTPQRVRALVGPRCEIGLSITDVSQLDRLFAEQKPFVNVLGIGPVYDARATKADATAALGLDGLAVIVQRTPMFLNCAIGGITRTNASDVLAAGAQGLAVVSAFSKAKDPYETARYFALLFDHRRK